MEEIKCHWLIALNVEKKYLIKLTHATNCGNPIRNREESINQAKYANVKKVVYVIIAIVAISIVLSSIVYYFVNNTMNKNVAPTCSDYQYNKVKQDLSTLMTALDSYRLDVGNYPSQEEGLKALYNNPGVKKWNGPYLRNNFSKDPWGNPYIYTNPGKHGVVDIISYGADGVLGGKGRNMEDFGSWQ